MDSPAVVDELLHLVFSSQGLEACLARRHPDQPVVLMGPTPRSTSTAGGRIYRLSLDLAPTEESSITTLSPLDLVVLTEQYPKSLSWS